MKRVVRRYGIVLAVILGVMTAGLWWVASRSVRAQANALPAGWQDLPLQPFIDQHGRRWRLSRRRPRSW